MAAQLIGNDSDAMNRTYKCPEDEKVPWETLSLRDLYGAVSRALGHELLPPCGMYELLALAISDYDEVGGQWMEKDQLQINVGDMWR